MAEREQETQDYIYYIKGYIREAKRYYGDYRNPPINGGFGSFTCEIIYGRMNELIKYIGDIV